MLTAADLTSMRSAAENALPGTAVIYGGGTFVSDSGGGGSFSAPIAGTVACRLAPIRGNEQETADRVSPDADSIVTLPFDATVNEESALLIDGETYNVAYIHDRSWNLTTRVEVTRRETP